MADTVQGTLSITRQNDANFCDLTLEAALTYTGNAPSTVLLTVWKWNGQNYNCVAWPMPGVYVFNDTTKTGTIFCEYEVATSGQYKFWYSFYDGDDNGTGDVIVEDYVVAPFP